MKHKFKGQRASSNDALVAYLKLQVEPNSSVLDIGCGPKLYSTPLLEQGSKILTIDAWSWVDPDIVADLEKTLVSELVDKKFDYILMIDFIEHLNKSAGLRLIEDCKRIVNKKIFLLTPMEEIWTENHEHVEDPRLWCYGNQYDLHKSIWTQEDFKDWTTISLPKFEDYFLGYFNPPAHVSPATT
jgi:hypothetical protein